MDPDLQTRIYGPGHTEPDLRTRTYVPGLRSWFKEPDLRNRFADPDLRIWTNRRGLTDPELRT